MGGRRIIVANSNNNTYNSETASGLSLCGQPTIRAIVGVYKFSNLITQHKKQLICIE